MCMCVFFGVLVCEREMVLQPVHMRLINAVDNTPKAWTKNNQTAIKKQQHNHTEIHEGLPCHNEQRGPSQDHVIWLHLRYGGLH